MSAVADQPALTVSECLRVPALEQARVVAGLAGLSTRRVRWLAVIEGPVEDFIAPGELVLTTGLDCGEAGFAEFVDDVAAADAAALIVGVGPDAPLAAVPRQARTAADRHGMPVAELPWAVRFADVLRELTDRLLSARYAGTLNAGDHLPTGFTDALLRRDGLAAIADALEAITGQPVLILDPGFALSAQGPLAAARPAPAAPAAGDPAPRELPADRVHGLRSELQDGSIHWLDPVQEAGLPGGLGVAAIAQGAALGYVLLLAGAPREPLIVERHALGHAAVAVAIESLRRRAVAEAEARASGDFLWELATDASISRSELATKAALLGYSIARPYHVLIARSAATDEAQLDELARHLRRHGALAGVHASRRGDRVLALVPQDAPPSLQPRTLAARSDELIPAPARSWGLAEGVFALTQIAEGLHRAERALRVGRALHGPGTLADGEALGPFLLLDSISRDPAAQRSAADVIAPLRAHDLTAKGGLVETLEAFLQAGGNTSAAARRLFLNRHSLMYRLRKIEALTGCDLQAHDDRFLLELSLRLRRMDAGG